MNLVALGKVAAITRNTIKPEEISAGTTYVGLEHITEEGNFVRVGTVASGELASAKFRFDERHVLYGKLRPYLRKIAMPSFTGICSTDILPILPGPEIDRSYLYHYLRTPVMVELATSRSTGANLPRLSPRQLESFEIPLPPLPEQRRIAAILDAADGLRAKRRAALGKLDALLQSVFLEMFGELFDAENRVSLSSLVQVNPSKTELPSVLDKQILVSFVPMPAVSEKGDIDLSETRILAEVWNGFTYFAEGDVLFAKITPCMENGKGAVAKGLCNGIGFGSTEFHVLRPTKQASSQWLYTLLSLSWVRKEAEAQMTGSAGQRRVPTRFFERFQIGIPDAQDVSTFSNVASSIRAMKQKMEKGIVSSDKLFDSLQQRAFRGEL